MDSNRTKKIVFTFLKFCYVIGTLQNAFLGKESLHPDVREVLMFSAVMVSRLSLLRVKVTNLI